MLKYLTPGEVLLLVLDIIQKEVGLLHSLHFNVLKTEVVEFGALKTNIKHNNSSLKGKLLIY